MRTYYLRKEHDSYENHTGTIPADGETRLAPFQELDQHSHGLSGRRTDLHARTAAADALHPFGCGENGGCVPAFAAEAQQIDSHRQKERNGIVGKALRGEHAGAGTLVPITGFANAISSAAIEAQSEGFILGVGAKIFTIAGPVILYGSAASVVYGIVYYFFCK